MTVSATDFNIYMETNVGLDTDIHAAVDAELLLSFVKNIPAQQIELAVEDGSLNITHHSGNASFDIFTDEFPKFPIPKTKNTLVVKGHVIKEGMQLTSFASADKDSPVESLKNSLWRFSDGRLTFFGFNPNFGATFFFDVESKVSSDLLIPSYAFSAFDNLIDNEDVGIVFDSSNMQLSTEHTKLSIRLTDGKYPDALSVIPTDGDLVLKVDRQQLISGLSRVRAFQEIDDRLNYRYIKFSVTQNLITITAEFKGAKRKATEQVICDFVSEDIEMMFNIDFLIAILRKLTSENITFTLKSYNRAAIITEDGQIGKDNLYLLMPFAKSQ